MPATVAASNVLDEHALRSGLSYNAIAEAADLDIADVHRYCKNKRRGPRDSILRICYALKLEVPEVNEVLESRRHLPLAGRRPAREATVVPNWPVALEPAPQSVQPDSLANQSLYPAKQ